MRLIISSIAVTQVTISRMTNEDLLFIQNIVENLIYCLSEYFDFDDLHQPI